MHQRVLVRLARPLNVGWARARIMLQSTGHLIAALGTLVKPTAAHTHVTCFCCIACRHAESNWHTAPGGSYPTTVLRAATQRSRR